MEQEPESDLRRLVPWVILRRMSTLAEIEQAIEKLPNEQLFQLTDWISTRFSDAWDRQIEQDIVAGEFDDLAAEAIAEHRAGQSLPMPADE
jgi:hypothetical protein